MDAESEELGGKRKFFTGDFARYGWAKLMDRSLGGHEMLGLYGEGISKMPENPGIPPLFRDIFKNAYLPYRDPETLKAFLKIIDEFSYDHSERLGDAFEYLLSVLGSQGDAGQFRTPRHIIDFMVEVLAPKKGETILDPACGTAGFLISAYKHILKTNSRQSGQSGPSQSTLTPDEKGRLARNFTGYDISPDMVRLSLVNLYLHGFTAPNIYEYDTLTSEERWNDFADVILANPPFMSPKGGIKPHKRFSIQAKRSEVLFVDYMAEHLTPTGRAAIIVPEGIIFQSQGAYKDLRKMLVENSLVAVISLPAGCFNPYSGVKTSILILDKSLARQCNTIAFFKVENDGFGLGAQRRTIGKNDLPQVQSELAAYLHALRSKSSIESILSITSTTQIVPKEKIAANGDYNLSGERYREGAVANHSFPLVFLGEESLFHVESGGTPKSDVEEYWGGGIPWATLVDLPATDFISQITATKRTISDKGLRESSAKMIPANSVVVSTRATIGRIAINRVPLATNQGFKNVVIEDPARAVPEFVALALTKLVPTMQAWATGGTFAEISKSKFCELQIPLPPLSVQQEIVAEIDAYQKVINGARAVLDNYRPHIPIHPDWPMVALGEVCSTSSGGTPLSGNAAYYEGGTIPWLRSGEVAQGNVFHSELFITEEGLKNSSAKMFPINTVLVAMYGATAGEVGILRFEAATNQAICGITPDKRLSSDFLYLFLKKDKPALIRLAGGGAQPNISQKIVREFKIPLPPLATQQAIVAEIEAEQALVAANRELITRFEHKIQSTLSRIWGDNASVEKETDA
jgi:type I restriction enzyme M protein